MAGFREQRRVTDIGAVLIADGERHRVSIRNVSSEGMRVIGLPEDLEAFKIVLEVASEQLEGIVVWQEGTTAGLRMKDGIAPRLLGRLRHTARAPDGPKRRFLMS